MRVALHVDGPRIRGNERQALLLAEGLVRRGHEVRASCRAGPVLEAMREVGAGVTGIRPRGDLDPISTLAFTLWLRRVSPDVVLITSWKRAAVAALAARLARVPRILLRLGGLRGAERGLGSRVRRYALQQWFDGVVVNSEEIRSALVRDVPMGRERVHVVPNGLRFLPSPPAPLRDTLRLEAGTILVLAVTGLERNKGADLLVPVLARQESRVHLVVAGRGSPEQVEEIRAAAGAAGVADRLHLLGHRPDVPALLAAADAFILPSRMDSVPNSMLEAMAAGLPVVVTEVGGVRHALGGADGRPPAGWTAPVGDAEALAGALGEVVADLSAGGPESRARGSEAAARAAEWYSGEQMVSGYEAVLRGDE